MGISRSNNVCFLFNGNDAREPRCDAAKLMASAGVSLSGIGGGSGTTSGIVGRSFEEACKSEAS